MVAIEFDDDGPVSSINYGGGGGDASRIDNHLQQQFNKHYPPNGILNVRDFEHGVWSIAHSNDGNYLASGGNDKILTITNTSTNEDNQRSRQTTFSQHYKSSFLFPSV